MTTRWLDPQERAAWVRLVAVAELLPGVLDAQLRRDSDLSHFDYFVLAMLSESPERTLRMTSLAQRTNATLTRLSHAVRRLEERGLVERFPCPEDGRATNARLTAEGWDAVVDGGARARRQRAQPRHRRPDARAARPAARDRRRPAPAARPGRPDGGRHRARALTEVWGVGSEDSLPSDNSPLSEGRRMSYPGKVAAVFALALAGTIPGVAPAQALPDTSDNKIQVIQHNTDMGGPGPAMQAAAEWDGGVDAITFQELCKSQVPELEAAGYHVLWRLQRAATKSPAARATRSRACTPSATPAPTSCSPAAPATKRRVFKLLCADLRGTGVARTTVCTSHFPLDYNGKRKAPSGTQNRIKVANKIRDIVNRKISAGRRVVLTGDFNDNPKSAPLDRFYRVKGNGRFWEGDQRCGKTSVCRAMKPTTSDGRALDYFFASSPGVNKLTGVSKLVAKKYDATGHYVIRGSVKFGSLR